MAFSPTFDGFDHAQIFVVSANRGIEGCFVLPDFGDDTQCGPILVDTAIGTVIVDLNALERPPALHHTAGRARIQIGAPGFTNPVLAYALATDAADDPLAPQGDPAARRLTAGLFANTGRHLLAIYDYLFDGGIGYSSFPADPGRLGQAVPARQGLSSDGEACIILLAVDGPAAQPGAAHQPRGHAARLIQRLANIAAPVGDVEHAARRKPGIRSHIRSEPVAVAGWMSSGSGAR